MANSTQQNTDKAKLYDELLLQIQGLLFGEHDVLANLANVSALLFNALQDVNWLGFYRLAQEQLVLGPFQGKPACIRIPIGKGVCGYAVRHHKSVVVANVHEFSGHIPCDASTKSEIVIPLTFNDRAYAVLDIDSPIFNRFDDIDQHGLEKIVKYLEDALDSSHPFWQMPR